MLRGIVFFLAFALSGSAADHWVGTWGTAVVQRPHQGPLNLNNETLRQIVHTSIGGSRVRVVFTNQFGTAPLTIGAASLALRDKESALVPNSTRPLMFGGQASVTIPAGAIMLSDPVTQTVAPMTDLAIDVYLPAEMLAPASPMSVHPGAFQTTYVSQAGNFAGSADFTAASTATSWYFLSRVEVQAPERVGALVFFGDSITDGTRSTPNTNSRWPDQLARRLLAKPGSAAFGIINAAIAGNRLMSEGALNSGINALARFDRDVLAQPGATEVIVMEGINDIGNARQNPIPGATDLIAAQEQMIERAHARGFKIIGVTLTPFEGAAYFTPEGEAKRQAVNEWIRGGKAFDAVIDFDEATRDPEHPARFLPLYDSGDHLHPNDAGYERMGKFVDLKVFSSKQKTAP